MPLKYKRLSMLVISPQNHFSSTKPTRRGEWAGRGWAPGFEIPKGAIWRAPRRGLQWMTLILKLTHQCRSLGFSGSFSIFMKCV
jgi:hypothetical protein